MKHFGTVVALFALLMASLTGCKKNHPLPPNGQAPTITVPLSPTPQPVTSATPIPSSTASPQVSPSATPATNSSNNKVHKHHKNKPQTTTEAKNNTPEQPTSPIGQLSSGMSEDEEVHQRQSTAELLDGTDANIKRITRTLSTDEQATVTRIRNFQTQARTANDQGDPVRAHTLALKAFLLSDELVKR